MGLPSGRLEPDLRRKLYRPCSIRPGHHSEVGICICASLSIRIRRIGRWSRCECGVWVLKIGSVESVICLDAKLKGRAFLDVRRPEHRHIEVCLRRSAKGRVSPWHISEAIIRWIDECQRIEPLRSALIRNLYADSGIEVRASSNSLVRGSCDQKRATLFKRHDDVILPAACNGIQNAVAVQKALSLSEWQVVEACNSSSFVHIERIHAVVCFQIVRILRTV